MIFLGDLASPNQLCTKLLIRDMASTGLFQRETMVVNLEGVLQKSNEIDSFWKVYNHESVVNLKDVCDKLICSLANNHLSDYPENI